MRQVSSSTSSKVCSKHKMGVTSSCCAALIDSYCLLMTEHTQHTYATRRTVWSRYRVPEQPFLCAASRHA